MILRIQTLHTICFYGIDETAQVTHDSYIDIIMMHAIIMLREISWYYSNSKAIIAWYDIYTLCCHWWSVPLRANGAQLSTYEWWSLTWWHNLHISCLVNHHANMFELSWPIDSLFTRGQYWPSGIVVACVRPSVSPSVRHQVCPCDNSSPVQARITKFGP